MLGRMWARPDWTGASSKGRERQRPALSVDATQSSTDRLSIDAARLQAMVTWLSRRRTRLGASSSPPLLARRWYFTSVPIVLAWFRVTPWPRGSVHTAHQLPPDATRSPSIGPPS